MLVDVQMETRKNEKEKAQCCRACKMGWFLFETSHLPKPEQRRQVKCFLEISTQPRRGVVCFTQKQIKKGTIPHPPKPGNRPRAGGDGTPVLGVEVVVLVVAHGLAEQLVAPGKLQMLRTLQLHLGAQSSDSGQPVGREMGGTLGHAGGTGERVWFDSYNLRVGKRDTLQTLTGFTRFVTT